MIAEAVRGSSLKEGVALCHLKKGDTTLGSRVL